MLMTLGRGMAPMAHVQMRSYSLIDSIVSSTVFELDATLSGSYPGSGQTFASLTVSPADGETQSTYDVLLGGSDTVNASDPIFNGTAGDAAAYFALPAADAGNFSNDWAYTEQPDFIRDFHQSNEGQSGWIGIALQAPATWETGNNGLIGTESTTTKHGFNITYNGSAAEQTLIVKLATGSAVTFEFDNTALIPGRDYTIFFNFTHSSGTTTITCWLNDDEGVSVAQSVTDTTDCTGVLTLGNGESANLSSEGTRYYWFAMGNGAIDAADVAAMRAELATRHNRTYTNVPTFGGTYLDSVADIGVCFECDATLEESYPGAGRTIWSVIESPAVASREDYDFWLGRDGTNDADYPDFSGTPGDSGAGFAMSGVSLKSGLLQKSVTGTQCAKFPRSDENGSWVAILFDSEDPVSGSDFFWGQYTGLEPFVRLRMANDEKLDFQQFDGTSTLTIDDLTAALTAGTYLIIFTWDGTGTTDNGKFWINSATGTAFSGTFYTQESDTPNAFEFGARGDGSSPMGAGTVIKKFAGGNVFLDDTKAGNIIAHWEARDGADYTP